MAFLLVTPIATALSRNVAFPLLLLCALLLMIAVFLQDNGGKTLVDVAGSTFRISPEAPAMAIVLASILLALASLFWSPDITRGLRGVVGASTAALVCAYCSVLVVRHIDVPSWLRWASPLVIVLACLLMLSELTLGSPVRSFLGASTEMFRLNRAALAVTLMLPLLLLFRSDHVRIFFNSMAIIFVLLAVYFSESESAKFAVFITTALILLSKTMGSRMLVFLCGFIITISHIFSPLIVVILQNFTPRIFIENNFSVLVEHFIRIDIWWAYADQILERPIFGHGIQSSFWANELYGGDDDLTLHALSFGHPHNVSIQTWYELGFAGVVLSTALILAFLRQILRLPNFQQEIAAALTLAVWGIAYVSHGALQHWWWALVGIIVILFSACRSLVVSDL